VADFGYIVGLVTVFLDCDNNLIVYKSMDEEQCEFEFISLKSRCIPSLWCGVCGYDV